MCVLLLVMVQGFGGAVDIPLIGWGMEMEEVTYCFRGILHQVKGCTEYLSGIYVGYFKTAQCVLRPRKEVRW
jgi:hypothetical protein